MKPILLGQNASIFLFFFQSMGNWTHSEHEQQEVYNINLCTHTHTHTHTTNSFYLSVPLHCCYSNRPNKRNDLAWSGITFKLLKLQESSLNVSAACKIVSICYISYKTNITFCIIERMHGNSEFVGILTVNCICECVRLFSKRGHSNVCLICMSKITYNCSFFFHVKNEQANCCAEINSLHLSGMSNHFLKIRPKKGFSIFTRTRTYLKCHIYEPHSSKNAHNYI